MYRIFCVCRGNWGSVLVLSFIQLTTRENVFDDQLLLHCMSDYEEHDETYAIHKYSRKLDQILMPSAVLVEHWLKYLRHTFV